MNNLREAIVKKTGNKVEVYRSKLRGTWIDFLDCKTEYKEDELELT